jgi:squalene-hopene/tetraprenyl-beta-curcumene cyclase
LKHILMDTYDSTSDIAAELCVDAPAAAPVSPLDEAIERGAQALRRDQNADGYWCYEFEADCTISAEYVLMLHFMGEPDAELEQRIATYLRDKQCADGGWSLYPGGVSDLSCAVKAYYALKIVGDDPDAPHMRLAREYILSQGGAAHANVFTRMTLALFAQVPWRAVPFIPVEIMLLPEWFPFHIRKVSYWSRTVMVPLFILCTLKPRAENPRGVSVRELFAIPPEDEQNYFVPRSRLNRVFFFLDRMGRMIEPLVPGFVRRRAIARARDWFVERLNGVDGLGAIFPAMVNAHEALKALGYPADHPWRVQTREALSRLLVIKDDYAYCQPCVSPVWDSALACLALQACEGRGDPLEVLEALDWLKQRQLLDAPGDWQWNRPHLRGGGWAFEFANDHYPDIDDTPVVGWAMLDAGDARYDEAVARAAEWIEGMQSSCGGWASFDVDNTYQYLNEVPFADHGALLDPPTADVTARCVTFLSLCDRERYRACIERGLAYLRARQEPNGSWFGRWGTNYIYGTWSVLVAMEATDVPRNDPALRRAVAWIKAHQRADGGWGEDNGSYLEPERAGTAERSTSFQTAWAVLALISAGEAAAPQTGRGVAFLLERQLDHGLWFDPEFTAPGFPRVFYLKYHGYSRYFPLWALARYRNLGPS